MAVFYSESNFWVALKLLMSVGWSRILLLASLVDILVGLVFDMILAVTDCQSEISILIGGIWISCLRGVKLNCDDGEGVREGVGET